MALTTTYLGFVLPNPLIVGASPLCDDVSMARQLEDAGAAMLVMRSLFQEQLADDADVNLGGPAQCSYTDAPAYLTEPAGFRMSPDQYLKQIDRLKRAVQIPVVASLNGHSNGQWVQYARLIEQAGADALELNIYDPVIGFEEASDEVERKRLELIVAVRASTVLPLAVKLSRTYTSLPYFARLVCRRGVAGLVLFNRLYQPEIGPQHLDLAGDVQLSTPAELGTRLRGVAALAGRIRAGLCVSGGVHTAADVARATLAGADVVQMVSALLRHGPGHLKTVLRDLHDWLAANEYSSLAQLRGSMSFLHLPGTRGIERCNYMQLLNSWQPARELEKQQHPLPDAHR